MTSAIEKSVDELKLWTYRNKFRLDKLVEGEGTLGTWLAPTKAGENDQKIGCRLDFGNKIEQEGGPTVRRYQLQINSGARNLTLKALANKESHGIWSYADISLDEKPSTGFASRGYRPMTR
ncbi:hypothetical protein E4U09_006376 [Claviceps aff. purpurea]|uniref:Uncharacterized protein n=1 Tax=Claviceps aff. purpurea TaxID=1967640 RepID=A0A9P7U3X3_9HYPO|nr:hypothetical protein E4U09_006376 [Claviceps aff. purpurea]